MEDLKLSFYKYIIMICVNPIGLILLTPVRIIFDFFTITHPDFFRSPNTPANHDKKVKQVQEQVLNICKSNISVTSHRKSHYCNLSQNLNITD